MLKTITTLNNKNIFLSLLTAFLLSISFPDINIAFAIWFCLVPLLFAIFDSKNSKEAFYYGIISGFSHYVFLLFWLTETICDFGHLPFFISFVILCILALYLSCFVGVFAFFSHKIIKNPFKSFFIIPALWVSLEYIKECYIPHLSFPWELLGYSQYLNLKIIQIADIFGVYGVSFLIVTLNIYFFYLILFLRKKITSPPKLFFFYNLFVLFMVISCISYGISKIKTFQKKIEDAPLYNVAFVQGNIPQEIKWKFYLKETHLRKHFFLSQKAIDMGADLIVWPETSSASYFEDGKFDTKMILDFVEQMKKPFLIGGIYCKDEKTYNSAYLIDENGKIKDRYDKAHLVPFGEYAPLERYLPFIRKLGVLGDFSSAENTKILSVGDYSFATLICFEIIFANQVRKIVNDKSDFIVNISNEAWFGKTKGPLQHFSMSVFRAVENRRSVIKSANTGISSFVDPTGKIIYRSKMLTPDVKSFSLPIIKEKSLYTKYGNIFVILCLFSSVLSFLQIYIKEKN